MTRIVLLITAALALAAAWLPSISTGGAVLLAGLCLVMAGAL